MISATRSDTEDEMTTITSVVDHPYISALVLFVLSCIATRIITGFQVNLKTQHGSNDKPRDIPIPPYWLPLFGHTFEFVFRFQDYLQVLRDRFPSGIFTLRIAGGNHRIVVAPSLVKEIYTRTSLPVEAESNVIRLLDIGFGGGGTFRSWNHENHEAMWSVNDHLQNLMKDPFLGIAIKSVVTAVEDRMFNLVSGLPSWVDHSAWERSGQVEVVSSGPTDGAFVAEADLHGLISCFVGEIGTSFLMGKAFLENNPAFLDDLSLLDSKLSTIMHGLPSWLTPGVPAALRARQRLINAMKEHHRAMIDIIEGKDPGYKYDELNDVSTLIWERVCTFHKLKKDERLGAIGNLRVIWAFNSNTNPLIFWMLYYIYSDPQLLQQIREEIKPFIQIRRSEFDGLPIKEAPRLKIDISDLQEKCSLLNGALLETMRLEAAGISYRIATDDCVLSESLEDAFKVGKTAAERYKVKKGDVLAIPSIVHQKSPVYFQDPDKFDARRFWVEDTNENGEKQVRVDSGTMEIWGGGKSMCKGRLLAEQEILAFVAGIITLWDMEPVAAHGWKHPGDQSTIGAYIPKQDIRVKIWRRET